MPIKDQDKSDEQAAKGAREVDTPRVSSAPRLISGQWHDADGVLLSPQESQKAHRAADAKAAEAKRKALLGRSE